MTTSQFIDTLIDSGFSSDEFFFVIDVFMYYNAYEYISAEELALEVNFWRKFIDDVKKAGYWWTDLV